MCTKILSSLGPFGIMIMQWELPHLMSEWAFIVIILLEIGPLRVNCLQESTKSLFLYTLELEMQVYNQAA